MRKFLAAIAAVTFVAAAPPANAALLAFMGPQSVAETLAQMWAQVRAAPNKQAEATVAPPPLSVPCCKWDR